MSNCSSIDPLVTSYVDGELPAADRDLVERHVHVCPPCRARLDREQAVRHLLAARKTAMGECPPDGLRAKCAGLERVQAPGELTSGDTRARLKTVAMRGAGVARDVRSAWLARLAPLALTAALVLIVAGAFLYQLTTSSTRVMAAELTADHVKCFAVNAALGTHQTSEAVESSLASGFGWQVRLPKEPEREGLELVGLRPCLYGEGRVAHIMYRHNGRPVSLFMLPRTSRSDELMQIFGHEAAIWSVGDRTFVLIARETESEVKRLEAFVQASLR